MRLSSLLLTAVVGLAGFQAAPQSSGIRVESCFVLLIDDVRLPADLPSQEAGVLTTLKKGVAGAEGAITWGERVRAGMEVKKGDLLGQIDNRLAQKMLDVARYKLEMAQEEAGNRISVDYAVAEHKVALAEWYSALEVNKAVPDAVTKSELRKLDLSCQRYSLQTEQAEYELGIAAISVKAQRAQLDAAEHDLARRDIISPIDGEIVEVYPQEGEWLRPGDPIVRIVRMDQLWVEGRLSLARPLPPAVGRRTVEVVAIAPGMEKYVFKGKIDFVSPLVEGDGRFKVTAIVANQFDEKSGEWLLRPGMPTTMTIK